jgi:hypothetical protein
MILNEVGPSYRDRHHQSGIRLRYTIHPITLRFYSEYDTMLFRPNHQQEFRDFIRKYQNRKPDVIMQSGHPLKFMHEVRQEPFPAFNCFLSAY